ncbi:MAG: hypothetical protein KIH67_001380 [Candidatus Moranbacteria bacterium]|nr:hypothetical protein [Candidatus Moranbacteria bacterium]
MADEILKDIKERGVNFNKAFSWAAHRRGVFHEKNREQYNDWFTQVRKRVSEKENATLRKSLRGKRPWQHGKIVQTTCRRKKWRPDDPWGHEDEDNFIFPENEALLARLHHHLPLTDD